MQWLRNLRVGVRLGAGFGLVLALTGIMVGLVFLYLSGIGSTLKQLADEDLVKEETASTLDVYTRANALRTMELFFVQSNEERRRITALLQTNDSKAAEALVTLDQHVRLPKGRAIMEKLKPAREAYAAALKRTTELLESGDRATAEASLREGTLPSMERVQAEVVALSTLQKELANEDARAIAGYVDQARVTMLVVGCVALLAGTVAAWWLTVSITRPISQAVQVARTVAAGDLSSRIDVVSRDETGELLSALREMNESLVRIVGQVRSSSESIATGTSQIATGNSDLSQRTEAQASSLQQTAASMEELTQTVRLNSETAQQANHLALDARDAVQEGSQAVGEAVTTMSMIAQASQRIGEITGLIDGIAFQTNILALNAAVEAARAGEQGRGFAVVAAEVRTLAQRSAEAAREIKVLIGSSVERVETGSRQVQAAQHRMDVAVSQVQRVAMMVTEISSASQQQSQGIGQVGQAVQQLDQVTQQNAALVEESAAATESLRGQAAKLAEVVQVFRLAGTAA